MNVTDLGPLGRSVFQINGSHVAEEGIPQLYVFV